MGERISRDEADMIIAQYWGDCVAEIDDEDLAALARRILAVCGPG